MNKTKIIFGIASALLVGAGQILKGESEKGLKFMLTFYFGLPILLYVNLAFNGGMFLIVFGISAIFAIIFWLYNIWDAAR